MIPPEKSDTDDPPPGPATRDEDREVTEWAFKTAPDVRTRVHRDGLEVSRGTGPAAERFLIDEVAAEVWEYWRGTRVVSPDRIALYSRKFSSLALMLSHRYRNPELTRDLVRLVRDLLFFGLLVREEPSDVVLFISYEYYPNHRYRRFGGIRRL